MKFKITAWRATLLAMSFSLLIGCMFNTSAQTGGPPDPDGLLDDLYWAMTGGVGAPPAPNWEARLDPGFNRWRTGSSENWGPIAHAIALWRYDVNSPNTVTWWNTFFDCQNGGACSVPGVTDVGTLKYFKGSELLSNTYDGNVTTAIASVNFWARTHNFLSLADKARRYLRVTWSMYALAAGPGAASTYIDDYSGASNPCQVGAAGFYYTGPYIAAAGMRSTPEHTCQEDRGPIFSRALQLSITNKRELAQQTKVANYLQANWPLNVNTSENVYALDPSNRALVISHLNSGNAASTLTSVLAGIRTIVTYRFLGWQEPGGQQIRATVMESNRNHNTAAIYAAKYTASTGVVQSLFPWAPQPPTGARPWREGITDGYAQLLPNVTSPSSVQGSNIKPGETPNSIHGTIVKSLALPTSGKLYHVVIGPNQDAFMQ